MRACAFRTSPAVVRIAPSSVITALLCADCTRSVNLTEPVRFVLAVVGLCGDVYHTSAAYVILGAATVRYSCRIPLADTPDAVWASLLTRLIHASAVLMARSCWAFHLSLGSNKTPRNLYEATALTVVIWLVPV